VGRKEKAEEVVAASGEIIGPILRQDLHDLQDLQERTNHTIQVRRVSSDARS